MFIHFLVDFLPSSMTFLRAALFLVETITNLSSTFAITSYCRIVLLLYLNSDYVIFFLRFLYCGSWPQFSLTEDWMETRLKPLHLIKISSFNWIIIWLWSRLLLLKSRSWHPIYTHWYCKLLIFCSIWKKNTNLYCFMEWLIPETDDNRRALFTILVKIWVNGTIKERTTF